MRIRKGGKYGRASGRQGSVIVMALVMLTALLMLGAGMHAVARGAMSEVSSEVDDQRARCIAEAGIAEAMVSLRQGSSGAIGSQAAPAYLAGGLVWVTATPGPLPNQTLLTATAMVGSGRSAVEVMVEMEAPAAPLFYAVLNSKQDMPLAASSLIDSFDSELGSYASQATSLGNGHVYAKANGDVASNGSISMSSYATCFGDVTPGPGGTVSFANGAYVSGSTAPAPQPFSFPPINPPAVPINGAISVPMGGSQTLPSGTYGFTSATIGKQGSLTVTGPATVVLSGNFSGGMDGRLHIDATNGPVTFYVAGTYAVNNGFEQMPVGNSPMAVAFMVEGASAISFQSGSKVRGAFYLPNADVQFTSNCEIWGAFAANSIGMSSGTRFHYDESLMKHWQSGGNGGVTADPLHLLSWLTAPVQPADLARTRTDPFELLGVDPLNLATPTDSWVPLP